MKKLYNKLSDKSLGDLLNTTEEQEFLKDWAALAKVRNKIVHGIYYAGLEDEKSKLLTTQANSLSIFIKINDDIIRQKGS